MSRKTKSQLTVAATVAMLTALAACGSSGASSSGPGGGGGSNKKVTITYWQGWTDPASVAGITKDVRAFEKLHPNIKVNVQPLTGGDPKLITAISGGKPPDAATLFNIRDLGELASKGGLQNITKLAKQDGVPLQKQLGNYTPSAIQASTYNGSLYGLTLEEDTSTLFINTKIFKEAGITSYPKTTSQVAADAIKTTKTSGGRITQVGLLPGYTSGLLGWIFPYFNAQLYNPKTKTITPDSPGMVAALQWEKDLIAKMGTQQWENFNSQKAKNPIDNLFYDGNTAMSIEGDWSCTMIGRYDPKLQWVAVPPPYEDGHPQWANRTWIDGAINVIPTGSPHPKQALEFIDFMNTTGPSVTLENAVAGQSPLKSANAELLKTTHNTPCWKLLTKLGEGKGAFPWPVISDATDYQTQLATVEDSVVRGKAQAGPALKQLGQKLAAGLSG